MFSFYGRFKGYGRIKSLSDPSLNSPTGIQLSCRYQKILLNSVINVWVKTFFFFIGKVDGRKFIDNHRFSVSVRP